MLSFSAKGSDTHNENNHMAQHTSPPPTEETRTCMCYRGGGQP